MAESQASLKLGISRNTATEWLSDFLIFEPQYLVRQTIASMLDPFNERLVTWHESRLALSLAMIDWHVLRPTIAVVYQSVLPSLLVLPLWRWPRIHLQLNCFATRDTNDWCGIDLGNALFDIDRVGLTLKKSTDFSRVRPF